MTYLELVKSIAELLRSKASEYQNDQIVGFEYHSFEEAGRTGSGRICCEATVKAVDSDDFEGGDDSTAKTLVLLVILGEVCCRYPKARGRVRTWLGPIAYIIVYLGDAPPDTKAQLERKMRQAFRIGPVRCLCINEKTLPPLLVEQLAVSFAQGGLIDDSLNRFLCLSHSTDIEPLDWKKKQLVFVELIKRFTDPAYPASYATFRRQLRKIADDELGILQRSRSQSDDKERQAYEKLEIPKTKLQRRDPRDSLTISKAAQEYKIPRRTLYDQVKKEKIVAKDGDIPRSEIEKVEALFQKRENRKSKNYLVKKLYDEQSGDNVIDEDSIRRTVDRYLKRGFDLVAIARRLKSS